MKSIDRQWTTHKLFIIICSLFVILALAYNFANPIFEATDEIRHFRYIRYITLNKSLPPVSVESSKEMQAHHPPLYYILSALITFPIQSDAGVTYNPPPNPFWGFRYYEPSFDNKNQYLHSPDESWQFSGTTLVVDLARLISLLFGLGTAINAYRLGRVALVDDKAIALGAMALTAFNPMLLHGSVSINNDTIAAFFGSWVFVDSVALVRGDVSRYRAVTLGVAMGLGILSKASVWTLLPIIFVAYFIAWWKNKSHLTSNIKHLTITILLIMFISGWWFARNYFASGDVMGLSEYRSAWSGQIDRWRLISEAISGLPYAWTTFWARFNYGQVVLPDVSYQIIAIVCGISLIGLLRSWRALLNLQSLIIALSIFISLAGWGALMITIPATANARLVFQIFPALSVLLVLGWRGLFNRKDNQKNFIAIFASSIIAFLFALYALFGYLAPAYAYPQKITSLPADVKQVSANFEGAVEIVGYRISKESVDPSDSVEVTIYWKPLAQTVLPLAAFVHLVDGQQIIAAQRDTYHGLGAAPSNTWRVGDTFADVYRLYIPDTAYAPAQLKVRIGVWNAKENRPLIANESDALEIGSIKLNVRVGATPNPVTVNFANRVMLTGYDLDRRVLKPSATTTLTTYWRKLDFDKDYWMYVHLMSLDGKQLRALSVQFKPSGEAWHEEQQIILPNDIPDGQYFIEIGVTSDSQRKISMLASDGRQIGDALSLVRIRVER